MYASNYLLFLFKDVLVFIFEDDKTFYNLLTKINMFIIEIWMISFILTS